MDVMLGSLCVSDAFDWLGTAQRFINAVLFRAIKMASRTAEVSRVKPTQKQVIQTMAAP
jgi:hypothetical protein